MQRLGSMGGLGWESKDGGCETVSLLLEGHSLVHTREQPPTHSSFVNKLLNAAVKWDESTQTCMRRTNEANSGIVRYEL